MLDGAPNFTRIDFQIPLVALSPLHIGSGMTVDDERLRSEENKSAELSTIQKDHKGSPWIPGSALKGALRAHAKPFIEDDILIELFGKITNRDTGQMGAALIRGANMTAAGLTVGLPYGDAEQGTYVSARTAIDPGRGIAQRNRLFHREMTAPGARFLWHIRLETTGDAEALSRALLDCLSPWAREDGVSIGSEAASGLGMVRIDGNVTQTDWQIDPAYGKLEAGPIETASIKAATALEGWRGTLICVGPFLTADPSWTAIERQAAKAKGVSEDELPHLKGLRLNGAPFITGEAISGALRSRYDWRFKLGKLRGEPIKPSVERLFGETGRKAVLTVAVTRISSGDAARTTSVRIDRFSGGPIDNALFSIDGDTAVRIDLRLSLDSRGDDEDEDRAALTAIIADLNENGLNLGHGSGRGFGWFRLEED